jgi:hypothetical protein
MARGNILVQKRICCACANMTMKRGKEKKKKKCIVLLIYKYDIVYDMWYHLIFLLSMYVSDTNIVAYM